MTGCLKNLIIQSWPNCSASLALWFQHPKIPLGITAYPAAWKIKLSLDALFLCLPTRHRHVFFSSANVLSLLFTWPVFSSLSPLPLLSGLMSDSQHLPGCQQRWPRRHSVGYLFRGVEVKNVADQSGFLDKWTNMNLSAPERPSTPCYSSCVGGNTQWPTVL